MFVKPSLWFSSIFLTFLIVSFLVVNSSGLSVSYSYHDGSGSISDSQNYNLDASTSIKSTSVFEGGSMQQRIQANGEGQNSLGQQIKGNLYSSDSTLSSSGSFSVSSSTRASSSAASLSQDAVGVGSMGLALQGSQGSQQSGQDASVAYGILSSSQSLSAGQGIASSQNTKMSGLTGQAGMGSFSQDRALLASSSFLGAGTLSARMSSESAGKPDGAASVSVDGKQWLGEGDLKEVSKHGNGISVNGLRLDQMGNLGTFSMQAVSMNLADYEADLGQKQAKSEAGPALAASSVPMGIGDTSSSVNYLNNPSAYVLTGWKWVTTDPQIKLYIKSDTTLPNYLDLTATKNAIASAANTWDDAVTQNIFADGSALVTVDPNVEANADDNKNVHSWASISGGLAITTTRFHTTKVDGFYPVYDSDTLYNTNYHWATNGNGQDIDVQSVALHELGHTIGLDDLYNKPQFSGDTDEIMNFYIGPRHSLGPGDKAGIQVLYGAAVPPFTGASGGYSFSGRS
jgi:hypothetical protein